MTYDDDQSVVFDSNMLVPGMLFRLHVKLCLILVISVEDLPVSPSIRYHSAKKVSYMFMNSSNSFVTSHYSSPAVWNHAVVVHDPLERKFQKCKYGS
jgi:hypothetical protein